jgi:hypothetical protein
MNHCRIPAAFWRGLTLTSSYVKWVSTVFDPVDLIMVELD